MTLTFADEFPHDPGADQRWQETYWFSAWDHEHGSGVDVHLDYQPHEGYVEVQVIVGISGELVTLGGRYAVGNPLAIPGLETDIRVPMEHWTLRYSGMGVRGTDEFGLSVHSTGDVPFGFSLDFHQFIPPVDFGSLYQAIRPGILNTSYAGAARFTGEVWREGIHVPISGLLLRDHSWGPRDFVFDLSPGGYFALDHAATFLSATTFLHGERWAGLCVIQNESGTQAHGDPWVRLDGLHVVGGFRSATIRLPDTVTPSTIQVKGDHSISKWTPSSNSRSSYLWQQLFCTTRWGEKTGQGAFWVVYPSAGPFAATMPPSCRNSGPLPIVEASDTTWSQVEG